MGLPRLLSGVPSVNTAPHGGQINVHSTSQHSTTWWSDQRAFHQSTTSTTWWSDERALHQKSDQRAFHQSTQHHMVVRSTCIPSVNTVTHGGQINVPYTSQHSAVRSEACVNVTTWCQQRLELSANWALRAQCELTLNRLTLTICMQFSTHHLIYGRYNSQIAAYATSEPTHGEC